MTEYDELYRIAEHQRIYEYKPAEAISNYREALEIGGPRDRHIIQMIGVCYQMLHESGWAMIWYERALQLEGATDHDKGNILRDMGAAREGMGHGDDALEAYRESLRLLEDEPGGYAATLGFMGRHFLDEGDLTKAMFYASLADQKLREAGNRKPELYNKLWLANVLSRNGNWLRSRRASFHSFWLSLRHGAGKHSLRALALFFGGWRADERLRQRFGAK